MNFGYFSYPIPSNEPVHSYAPGTLERAALKKTLAELKSQQLDVPMYIGGEEVRTGKLEAMHPVFQSRKHGHGYACAEFSSSHPLRLFRHAK